MLQNTSTPCAAIYISMASRKFPFTVEISQVGVYRPCILQAIVWGPWGRLLVLLLYFISFPSHQVHSIASIYYRPAVPQDFYSTGCKSLSASETPLGSHSWTSFWKPLSCGQFGFLRSLPILPLTLE